MGKPLSDISIAYEVLGPKDLFVLLMINDPPVFMYKPDRVNLTLVERFTALHSSYNSLIDHYFVNSFNMVELCNKRLDEIGMTPCDHSIKHLLPILKKSAEEDRKRVIEACTEYFNSRAPYRFDLDWNSSIQASAGES